MISVPKYRHSPYWCDHCHYFEGYSGIGPYTKVHCNGCKSDPLEIRVDRACPSCYVKSWGSA
jgi:hypothetical protein